MMSFISQYCLWLVLLFVFKFSVFFTARHKRTGPANYDTIVLVLIKSHALCFAPRKITILTACNILIQEHLHHLFGGLHGNNWCAYPPKDQRSLASLIGRGKLAVWLKVWWRTGLEWRPTSSQSQGHFDPDPWSWSCMLIHWIKMVFKLPDWNGVLPWGKARIQLSHSVQVTVLIFDPDPDNWPWSLILILSLNPDPWPLPFILTHKIEMASKAKSQHIATPNRRWISLLVCAQSQQRLKTGLICSDCSHSYWQLSNAKTKKPFSY